MLRKPQVKTRTNSRRGKKLKGLTPQEARLRAVKGWRTRHLRYGRKFADERAPDPHFDDVTGDRVSGGAPLRPKKRPLFTEDEAFSKLEADTHMSAADFQRMRKESREWITNEAGAENFVPYLSRMLSENRQHLTQDQVNAFSAYIAGARELEKNQDLRLRKVRSGEGEGFTENVTQNVRVRKRVDDLTRPSFKSGTPLDSPNFVDTKQRALESLRDVSSVDESHPFVKDRPRQPTKGVYKAPKKGAIRNQIPLAADDDLDALASAIAIVHHAPNAAAKSRAQDKVKQLSNKLATGTQQTLDKKTLEDTTFRVYASLSAAGLKVSEPKSVAFRRPIVTAEDIYKGRSDSLKLNAEQAWTQRKTRTEALRSGDLYVGLKDGQVVHHDKATTAMRANKQWVYEVKDPKSGKITTHRLPWEERRSLSKLFPGQEIVSEKAEKQFKSGVLHTTLGRTSHSDLEETLPSYYGKKYSLQGKQGESEINVVLPANRKYRLGERVLQKRVDADWEPGVFDHIPMDTTGMAHELVTGPLRARRERIIREQERQRNILLQERAGRFPKSLEEGTRHDKRLKVKMEELARKQEETAEAGFVYHPKTGQSKILTGPEMEKLIQQKDERAGYNAAFSNDVTDATKFYTKSGGLVEHKTADEMKAHLQDQHDARVKNLTKAGLAASFYGAQRMIKEGYIPDEANKITGKIGGKSMSNIFPSKSEIFGPLTERVANFWTTVKNPTTSKSGSSYGIRWELWKDRPVGRVRSQDDYDTRQLEKKLINLQRVGRTEEFMHKNVYSGNRAKRWLANKQDPFKNMFEYQNFEANLKQTIAEAREVMMTAPPKSKKHKEAAKTHMYAFQELQNKLKREGRHPGVLGKGPQRMHINPPGTGGKIEFIRTDLLPTVITPKPKGNLGRNVLIGGGVVATAFGAHYLYHRLQERKKPKDERTAYYNKILPGPVRTGPLPSAQVQWKRFPHNTVTKELLLDKKKYPTGVELGKRSRTLWRGSPADRGYDKNLPFVHRVYGGGTRGRPGLFLDAQDARSRKRSRVTGTHDVVIRGRQLPVDITVGKQQKVKLKTANPNALSSREKEDLIWAYATPMTQRDKDVWERIKNRPDTDLSPTERMAKDRITNYVVNQPAVREVLNFHVADKRLHEMVSDPDRVENIFKKRQGEFMTNRSRPGGQRDEDKLEQVFQSTIKNKTLQQVRDDKETERRERKHGPEPRYY